MNFSLVHFSVFLAFVSGYLCYCPPLIAPETTELKCEEPIKQQRVNCSASWLPSGTVAYFRCFKERAKRAKGRITCSEDGIHRLVQKPSIGNFSEERLPCGIKKDFEKADIHIYAFQPAVHYDLESEANGDFLILGEALHNEFRKKHGSPPLKLQANLTQLAQNWANKISINSRLDMAPDLPFGQNVFLAQTSNLTAAVNDAVRNWYFDGLAEYCWEDVTENWSNSLSLEFSQIIWKESQFLGIGTSVLKSGNETAVIAFYDPTGNIIIEGDEESSENIFELNVPPVQTNITAVL